MVLEETNRFPTNTSDHLLTIRNRKRIDMTAIKMIERFDQEEFSIHTAQGYLVIRGEGLKIVHLDVDKGLLTLEGNVKNVQYDEPADENSSKGLLHKLFG